MARVTVEDCILVVPNRFELVALASQRAKDISSGATLTIDRDNDKNTVVALREIAEHTVDADLLREVVIQNSQRKVKTDKFEADPSVVADPEADDITQEIESFAVPETFAEEDGMSFVDDNIEVED